MSIKYDVVIIGFGPVGATLAALLGKRGLKVAVIEKDPSLFPHPRAAHVDHTGLRTLQEIGILDELLPDMVRNMALEIVDKDRQLLMRIPADQPSTSGLPLSMYFYQPTYDAALRNAAQSFANVDVSLGAEMTAIDQDEQGVRVTVREGGEDRIVEASWLVGCDGAWSPVRESQGIKFENLDFDEKWLVLDIQITGDRGDVPPDRVINICDPKRPHLTTPISKDRQRFEFMMLPGEDPEAMRSDDNVAVLLSEWLAPGSYRVDRSAIYTFHGLLAEKWRNGRVLIAGDAAHMMPPFLGQGMNSGVRDAVNVAWKLDEVIRGGAPDTLLDSYESERSPHVRRVIEGAIAVGKVICVTDPAVAEERNRQLLANEGGAKDALFFRLPRLTASSMVRSGGGALFPQPEIEGRRLDDIVGQNFMVLTRGEAPAAETIAFWRDTMGAYIAPPEVVQAPVLVAWMDRAGVDAVVVRPDRHVLASGGNLDDITNEVAASLRAAA